MKPALKEDTRQPKYIYQRLEPITWCECCEKPLFIGQEVYRDLRFNVAMHYYCAECYEKEQDCPASVLTEVKER